MRHELRDRFRAPQAWSMTLFCLAAYCVLSGLGLALHGDDREPAELPTEEPQTLLAPVDLLPVEPGEDSATVGGPTHPATAPPVKLAPEISAWGSRFLGPSATPDEGLKPASFQEITPGETTLTELIEQLGEPAKREPDDGGETLTYSIGPFPQVCIAVREDVVESIVIHLASPSARTDVVTELGLQDYRSAAVLDDGQRPLGEVFPERGILFAYVQESATTTTAQVDHVVLERITAEPFLLRVEQTPADHLTARLADLRRVQELTPQDATACDLTARLELASGRPQTAEAAARQSVELDEQSASYRITLGEAQYRLGQTTEAMASVRRALQQSGLSALDQVRGRLLLGRLLATATPRDYRQAMDETVATIKLASAQANRSAGAVQREFQELLIDAELSLAVILAHGPWKQKHEVVPQWLAAAEKAANEYVHKQGGSRHALLSVYRTSLHCLAVLEGQGSPDTIASTAIDVGRELVAEVDDDDYRAAIEWQLGTALWHAAQVTHQQGRAADALRYATNADVLLGSASQTRGESPEMAHHLGQVRFLAGSIYALQMKDDESATRWYDKALPDLQAVDPSSLVDERGRIGEQLVSVGISLWETGRRNAAISVTEEGTSLLLRAASDGLIPKSTLSIPYQNLAAMHRELGNAEQADRLASKAAEADPQSKSGVKLR